MQTLSSISYLWSFFVERIITLAQLVPNEIQSIHIYCLLIYVNNSLSLWNVLARVSEAYRGTMASNFAFVVSLKFLQERAKKESHAVTIQARRAWNPSSEETETIRSCLKVNAAPAGTNTCARDWFVGAGRCLDKNQTMFLHTNKHEVISIFVSINKVFSVQLLALGYCQASQSALLNGVVSSWPLPHAIRTVWNLCQEAQTPPGSNNTHSTSLLDASTYKASQAHSAIHSKHNTAHLDNIVQLCNDTVRYSVIICYYTEPNLFGGMHAMHACLSSASVTKYSISSSDRTQAPSFWLCTSQPPSWMDRNFPPVLLVSASSCRSWNHWNPNRYFVFAYRVSLLCYALWIYTDFVEVKAVPSQRRTMMLCEYTIAFIYCITKLITLSSHADPRWSKWFFLVPTKQKPRVQDVWAVSPTRHSSTGFEQHSCSVKGRFVKKYCGSGPLSWSNDKSM